MPNALISYKGIFNIALPLVLAGLGYSLVSATDTFFLGHTGNTTYLAAIGIMSPFYLVITLLGMAFARGGQILIARRMGEQNNAAVGVTVRNLTYLMLAVSVAGFGILKFGGRWVIGWFVDDAHLLDACYQYLYYRVDSIVLGFVAAVIISTYAGIGRTRIIVIDAVILTALNALLNYGLIYGNWGLPKMGIGGAGLASSIAENVASAVMIGYMYGDKKMVQFRIFEWSPVDMPMVVEQLRLSVPIALQSLLGLGSWVAFFGFVENLGERPLAVSSVLRVVYVFFGVPAWGLASATNTIVSQLIGEQKSADIRPFLRRIVGISLFITCLLCASLVFTPNAVSRLVTNDQVVVNETLPLYGLLVIILMVVAVYNIYFNAIVGAGDIRRSLLFQIIAVSFYMAYIYVAVEWLRADLVWVWCAELLHATTLAVLSVAYVYAPNTHHFSATAQSLIIPQRKKSPPIL